MPQGILLLTLRRDGSTYYWQATYNSADAASPTACALLTTAQSC